MGSAEGLTAEPYYPIFAAHIKVQRKVCCCGQEVAELSTGPHDTNITNASHRDQGIINSAVTAC